MAWTRITKEKVRCDECGGIEKWDGPTERLFHRHIGLLAPRPGLGDRVEQMVQAMCDVNPRLTPMVKRAKIIGCGCNGRKAWLNNLGRKMSRAWRLK
jgi:hypothetical protein